ncbi:hypothetical protein Taro_044875 [Colocasia esculenta]|uniref:Uncharacterized protein n=1 Tax=Colocasia esculenta TaxID=4460 RepID=A0A843WMZ1_COLES|nr:hypothetical protein [Colocasia esculenta]
MESRIRFSMIHLNSRESGRSDSIRQTLMLEMGPLNQQDVLPELIEHPCDARVGHDLQRACTPSSVETHQTFLSNHLSQGCSHVGWALTLQGSHHQPLPGNLQWETDECESDTVDAEGHQRETTRGERSHKRRERKGEQTFRACLTSGTRNRSSKTPSLPSISSSLATTIIPSPSAAHASPTNQTSPSSPLPLFFCKDPDPNTITYHCGIAKEKEQKHRQKERHTQQKILRRRTKRRDLSTEYIPRRRRKSSWETEGGYGDGWNSINYLMGHWLCRLLNKEI